MARQAGYEITLRIRLPVDQKNTNDVIAKAKAIQKAEQGDIAALLENHEVDVKEFKQTFTSWNTGTGRAGTQRDEAADDTSSQLLRAGQIGRTGAQRFEVILN